MVNKKKRIVLIGALSNLNRCLGVIQEKSIESAVNNKLVINNNEIISKNVREILEDIVTIGKLFDIEYSEISKYNSVCSKCGRDNNE